MIQVWIHLIQHAQCSNMMSITQRQESLIRAKPGHRIHLALEKMNMTFSSKPTHRRTIFKDWKNKCIVATKQHRGVHKDTLHQPQNTNSLRDTRDNDTHMVFEGEPAVKLHAKNVEVGTIENGSPNASSCILFLLHPRFRRDITDNYFKMIHSQRNFAKSEPQF